MLFEAKYKHWEGEHRGIWYRRWVIAIHGLKNSMQGRSVRWLLTLCWSSALVQIAVLFLIGQLLVEDSIVFLWIAQLDSTPIKMFSEAMLRWLIEHPEISVRTTYNLFYYFYSTMLSTLAILSVLFVLPHLICRDLSSRAILVYSSKAVSRFDYLLGKFLSVMGMLSLIWMLPLCASWFVGNLLAPDWSFFWHSKAALVNVVLYTVTSMTLMSLLAMGVSSLTAKPGVATIIWILFWLVGNAMVGLGMATKSWLKFLSFSFDLRQLAIAIFDLKHEVQIAQDNIPLLGNFIRQFTERWGSSWMNPELNGALVALSVMVGLALFILHKKVRPE